MKFKKLTDKQNIGYDILVSQRYSEIFFDGGSRSGKTFLVCVFCILVLCLNIPNIRILFARLRFSHAKSSIWLQTLLPFLKDNISIDHYKVNKSDYIVTFYNGSEIWLGGLDDKDRTEKVLGQEYAVIFLNESVISS